MSKKIEDSELQTLTLSPTNTNDDESSPFVNPASDETSFPISPPPSFSTVTTSSTGPTGEKRKLERMVSAPGNSTAKIVPTLRVSTPPGSTRISYTNERLNERKFDLSKISRDRPTPGNSIGQKKDILRQTDHSLPSPGFVVAMGSVNKGFQIPKPESKTGNLENTLAPSIRSQPGRADVKILGACSRVTGHIRHMPSYTLAGPGSARSTTPHSLGITLPTPPSRGGASNRGNLGSKVMLSRPVVRPGLRMRGGLDARQMDRPIQHHTFLADVADVRQIEQGLLQLMEDFQAGNLRAFGKDSRLRQMEAIREQQERLARLHFDVGAEQDLYPPLSEEGLRTSHDNMRTLMEKLAQLSESIERLHTNTSSERKFNSNERKTSSQFYQRATENSSQPKIHSGGWNRQTDGHAANHHGGEPPPSIPQTNAYNHVTNNTSQHASPGNSPSSHVQHSASRLRSSTGNQSAGIMKNAKVPDS